MKDERHPGPMWMTVDGFIDTASGCFVRHERCMIVLAMVAGAAVAIFAMMVMLLLMLLVVVVQLVLLQLLLLLLLLQLIIERPELVPASGAIGFETGGYSAAANLWDE